MKSLKYIIVLSVLALGIISQVGCNEDFEEYNQDPFALTNTDLEADYRLVGEPFINIIRNIYVHTPAWVTQLQQNLIGDVYSGYMMPPTPFAGNSNNMNYNLVDGWNTWAWNPTYQNVLAPGLQVERNAGDEFPEFLAWLKILKVEAVHRVSDMFGPVIYSNFGVIADDGSIAYDCEDDLFNAYFADLEEGIAGLDAFLTTGKESPFVTFDEVYDGDISKWIKFANTLRLRLAIRIANVAPDLAKQQAEKSFNHPLGLLTTNDDNFNITNGVDHPVNTINSAWNDIRMGAPMESILVGYNDPRLAAFFQPATQENVAGQYKGIRQGIEISDKGTYVNYSALQSLGDVQLMVAAESHFLQAEAALRGWGVGTTAQAAYELGIQTSFAQYGLNGADNYISDASSKPIPYVDVNNATNSVPEGNDNLSTATIAWDESASFEEKLEKIITQKWIAIFPDGSEAWAEYRRTGYPKLFPVVINNSGGEVNTEEQIKRIRYVSGEYAQNPGGVSAGVSCLGGNDSAGASLWWDVN